MDAASASQRLTPIPGPRPRPVVGNIPDLDPEAPVQAMMRLVDELCDERRFDKKVHRPLENIREFAGDGLFTAHTQEPNWGKAHRILMPVFGPAAPRRMFPDMC